jgi:hypothetical protein
MEVLRRVGLKVSLYLLRQHLSRSWCIWRDSFRSFRGHIRTQSAKGRATATFGAWFENHHGHLRANRRTAARREYTEKLRAIRPWVDSQDLEIFLMGFDAGEERSAHRESGVEARLAESAQFSPSVLQAEVFYSHETDPQHERIQGFHGCDAKDYDGIKDGATRPREAGKGSAEG